MPVPEQLTIALLSWFAQHARDLPWRKTLDPYAIWVSEIMLQQTQVSTVIPYWERWMRALPDVNVLSDAPLDAVLKLWEGLGYYSRARNLQRAAQLIVAEHQGVFPRDYEAIVALPGIGRYTAGAICSIAFDQPTPIVDGNVTRVLSRLFTLRGNPAHKDVNKRLWSRADDLVQSAGRQRSAFARPCSALNQALMELGATICAPKQPHCGRCPARRWCRAHQTGQTESLPQPRPRPQVVHRRFAVFLANRGKRWLVRQRPGDVVNGHLWEFPNVEIVGNGTSVPVLASECLGFPTSECQSFCTVRHTITRFRIRLDVYRVKLPRGPGHNGNGGAWQDFGALEKLAFPSAHRKILCRIQDEHDLQNGTATFAKKRQRNVRSAH